MFPANQEMELALLKSLDELGGEGTTQQVYELLTGKFPQLTENELRKTLPSGNKKWWKKIQAVKTRLDMLGKIESSKFGVWRITQKGQLRVQPSTSF